MKIKRIWMAIVGCLMAAGMAFGAFAMTGCADNAKLVGFDTKMAEAFAAAEGLTVEFRLIEWSAKEQELESGRSDLVWNGLTVTEERRAHMELSINYMTNKQVAVIRKADAEKYTDKDSIIANGARIVAESKSAGAEQMDAFPAACSKKNIGSQRSAMLDVKTKHCDVAIVDMTMAEYLCNKDGTFSTLTVIPDYYLTEEEHYAVAAKKGNVGLIAKINDFLVASAGNGSMRAVATEYALESLLETAYVNEKPYDSLSESEKADWLAVKDKGKIVVAYTLNAPIAMRV